MRVVAVLLIAASVLAAGCRGSLPNGLRPAKSVLRADAGKEHLVTVDLPESRPRAGQPQVVSETFSFPGGTGIHQVYRDYFESWFRSQARLDGGGANVHWEHRAEFEPDAVWTVGGRYLVTRGCVEWEGDLPPGSTIRIREWLIGRANSLPRVIYSYPAADGEIAALPRISERALDLGVDPAAVKGVRYIVDISIPGGVPQSLGVYLSPQIVHRDELASEQEAEEEALEVMTPLLGEEVAGRFTEWYLRTASDFVAAHIHRAERSHCYLQAEEIRHWARWLMDQDPELMTSIRVAGIRRTPVMWQSSNLIAPANDRALQTYVKQRDGVVIDTWRQDGSLETKTQPMSEFRGTWATEYVEEEVQADSVPRPFGNDLFTLHCAELSE